MKTKGNQSPSTPSFQSGPALIAPGLSCHLLRPMGGTTACSTTQLLPLCWVPPQLGCRGDLEQVALGWWEISA